LYVQTVQNVFNDKNRQKFSSVRILTNVYCGICNQTTKKAESSFYLFSF